MMKKQGRADQDLKIVDYICGKRLQAVVAELVTVLERNNELSCDQQIREMDLVGHNGVAAGDRRAADRQTKETTTVSEV